MSPHPGSRRRGLAVGLLSLLLGGAVAATTAGAPPADAQTPARLDLEGQTLFVDDEPAEIVLRVSSAPDDARLHLLIHDDAARTRDEVRAHHERPPTGGRLVANFECTLAGDCFEQAAFTRGPDGLITITLDDDVIGESLRNNTGALPFVVELLDEDGAVLDRLATSLIVLPDDAPSADGPRLVRLAFTSSVVAPLALRPDGDLDLDVDAVLADTAALAANPELEITTELRPETLDALADVDPEALAELLEIVGDRPVVRVPWVDLDEEAWRRVGETDQVVSQYAIADDTFETHLGRPPGGTVQLDPDAGADTLALLRSVGATTVLVAGAHLDAATLAAPSYQPFLLLDANGVGLTALRHDEALHETLDEPDAELAAYRAVAELSVLALEADTEPGIVLDIDRIDPEALDRMLDAIAVRRALRVDSIDDLARQDLARVDGETLRAELVPSDPPDVTDLAADLEDATLGLATVARMIEPEIDSLTPLVARLQAAVSADLDRAAAGAYVDAVTTEVDALTTGFEILDGDRITLTDRRTDLPLTIVNEQSVTRKVEMVLTAEKIRFPAGDRLELELAPGENSVTIPVETLASGDARIGITLVSPGGFLELADGTVDIRSTAISGLGLVISVVALVVLGVWWIRTIRRVRRNRAAATVSDDPTQVGLEEGEP